MPCRNFPFRAKSTCLNTTRGTDVKFKHFLSLCKARSVTGKFSGFASKGGLSFPIIKEYISYDFALYLFQDIKWAKVCYRLFFFINNVFKKVNIHFFANNVYGSRYFQVK